MPVNTAADDNRILEVPAPSLDLAAVARIARENYELTGDLTPLDSERDQNLRLSTADKDFVIKIANAAEEPAVVDLQVEALEHVASVDATLAVPRVRRNLDGDAVTRVRAPGGTEHLARVVTWLDGELLGDTVPDAVLLDRLGVFLARLGRALRGFFHPAAGRAMLWDLKQAASLRAFAGHVEDRTVRRLVDNALDDFDRRVQPLLPEFRAQVIHSDLNPGNALVVDNEITGAIDFGDLVHAPLVNDPAIACAYQVGHDDPLAPVCDLVAAYHRVTPLEELEIDLLHDLIRMRLTATIIISSWRAGAHPDNRDYILGSQTRAVRALAAMSKYPRRLAVNRLRTACGLEPHASKRTADHADLPARRERLLGPTYRLFYERPLEIVRGQGVWLYDADGRAYLDVYNNVAHVGHCHPRVVGALSQQARTLNTHTRYLHEFVVDFAERLGKLVPFTDPVCMFTCTGSEANELAYRIAMAKTRGRGVLVTEHSYHGNTSTVAQLSTSDTPPERRGDFVATMPAPDSYRGAHAHGAGRLIEHYLGELDRALEALGSRQIRPAALLIDTIFSCDGVVAPPPGFVAAAAERIRAVGGVFIADEVQAGFGRTGEKFWGFERHGALPDIVTLGKPMGNGFPLAAVITTRALVEPFARETDYFNTFGGNPVACAAGLAVLDVLETERLQDNALAVGRYLEDKLRVLATRLDIIGDVRGAGLFRGVELVRDRATLEPARAEAHKTVNAMREHGVLIGATGPHGNVLKIRPPMVFDESNADQLVETLDAALTEL